MNNNNHNQRRQKNVITHPCCQKSHTRATMIGNIASMTFARTTLDAINFGLIEPVFSEQWLWVVLRVFIHGEKKIWRRGLVVQWSLKGKEKRGGTEISLIGEKKDGGACAAVKFYVLRWNHAIGTITTVTMKYLIAGLSLI